VDFHREAMSNSEVETAGASAGFERSLAYVISIESRVRSTTPEVSRFIRKCRGNDETTRPNHK